MAHYLKCVLSGGGRNCCLKTTYYRLPHGRLVKHSGYCPAARICGRQTRYRFPLQRIVQAGGKPNSVLQSGELQEDCPPSDVAPAGYAATSSSSAAVTSSTDTSSMTYSVGENAISAFFRIRYRRFPNGSHSIGGDHAGAIMTIGNPTVLPRCSVPVSSVSPTRHKLSSAHNCNSDVFPATLVVPRPSPARSASIAAASAAVPTNTMCAPYLSITCRAAAWNRSRPLLRPLRLSDHDAPSPRSKRPPLFPQFLCQQKAALGLVVDGPVLQEFSSF